MRLETITDNLDLYWDGFQTTVSLSVVAAAASLVLGTVLAGMRVSPIPPLRAVGLVYVEIFRNTPLPVLAVLFVFGLPVLGLRPSKFIWVALALSIYTAAFVCEAVRSGINSVHAGQGEAARSLGLTFGQTMRLVVLPQAFRTVVPPLGSIYIAMTKNSAVAALVDVGDLTNQTEAIIFDTVDPLTALAGAAVAYFVLTITIGLLFGVLERRVAIVR